VADQIGHLAYFDGTAALAIADPDGFAAARDALIAGALADGVEAIDDLTLGAARAMTSEQLLGAWRDNRRRLADAAATLADDARVPWYGPSMSARSFLTARLMECWAHGQDVVDAVGGERPATDRLRHIAQLGYITRGWSYSIRSETPPAGVVALELTAPSGAVWTWGRPGGSGGSGAGDAAEQVVDTIRGPALDFCLVVTQRRHLDDTALTCGEAGRHWLLRAQAFAGGPTTGPDPRGK
jgi:uncharacterized protein (TIGR03084 family)